MSIQVPDMPELELSELLAYEKETTGLYISGHPMDQFHRVLRNTSIQPISRIMAEDSSFVDGETVTVAGVIQSVTTKSTRNNSLMAYVVLEDDTASVETLVFAAVLSQYENLLQTGAVVVMEARISVRDEKATQLIANKVDSVESFLRTAKSAARKLGELSACTRLYLKIPSEDSVQYRKTRAILNMFPGNVQAVLYFADTGLRRGTLCSPERVMLNELRLLLGESSVVEKNRA